MPHRQVDKLSVVRGMARRYACWSASLLVICISTVGDVRASSTSRASRDASTSELAIQVNNDRLTVTVAKAPQVYLYGVIDADAPQRFEALIRSSKIPNGSDIYLNASGGDLQAALALGRLFRNGAMVTHLGTPRLGRQSNTVGKPATCEGACAYAYLGGLYRWAPTGSDRIGFPSTRALASSASASGQTQPATDQVAAYLSDMQIDAATLAPLLAASSSDVVWLTADQMIATRLANNGRLPLTATYQLQSGAPSLVLHEVVRGSEHRMTLLCKHGGTELTASDGIGASHAQQIVAQGAHAYIELNGNEPPSEQQGSASVVDDAVVITQTYPGATVGQLVTAKTIGAWVRDRRSSLRFGFVFEVDGLKRSFTTYYNNCWQYAPWSTPQKS